MNILNVQKAIERTLGEYPFVEEVTGCDCGGKESGYIEGTVNIDGKNYFVYADFTYSYSVRHGSDYCWGRYGSERIDTAEVSIDNEVYIEHFAICASPEDEENLVELNHVYITLNIE